MKFTAIATGQSSGARAQTTFTDALVVTSRASGNWSVPSTCSAARTGTITTTTSSASVTGSGTLFLTELSIGDVITNTNDQVIGTVASIASNTSLTLTGNAALTLTNAPYKARRVPASSEDVVVIKPHTVTLDVNASCNSLLISASAAPTSPQVATLTMLGSNSLVVAGALTLTGPSGGNGGTANLNVGAGSAVAASFSAATNSANASLTTGSLSVTGPATVQGTGSTGSLVIVDVSAGSFSVGGNLSVLGGGGGTAEGRMVVGAGGQANAAASVTIDANSGLATVDAGPGTFSAGGNLSLSGGTSTKVASLRIGTGTATVFGNITFATVPRDVTFTSASGMLRVGGSLGNGGTLNTVAGSTIEFFGSSAGTMGAYTNYQNVRINKSGAANVALGGSATVNGVLTFNGGNVTTAANILAVAVGGSAVRTSGHVVGNFQKLFAVGPLQSFAFHIGSATDYTPIELSNLNVASAGSITATTTAGDHPNIATSGIVASRSVNRYWTLTAGGGFVPGTYDATVSFVNSEIDAGANPFNFIIRKFFSAAWTAPLTVVVATNSTRGNGFTTNLGAFAVGEPTCTTDANCNDGNACTKIVATR